MIKATARTATVEEAGRSCPYCRFTIKDAEVVVCPSCAAVEHQDCWLENGGCAVVGCVARPGSAQPVPVPSERPAMRSPSVGLIATVLIVALSVVGATVAFLISRSPASTSQRATGRTVVVVSPASAAAKSPAGHASTPSDPAPTTTTKKSITTAATSRVAREKAIEQVLTDYYGAVARGDFASAWALLSPSYKSWKASHGGHAKWVQQEQDNQAHLDPSGLRAAVRSFDSASGVATIYVSGMSYRKAGQATCPYTGVTWARMVEGRWFYDQGYLQNSARAAEWRPLSDQTLGVPCEPSGY